MRRYSPLRELFADRLRQFHREPEAVFWVYVFPLLLVAGLGLAFREDSPTEYRVAVVAEDEASAARVESALADDGRFVVERVEGAAKAGQSELTLVAGAAGIEYRVDPTNAESGLTRELVDAALQRAAGRTDPVSTETTQVTEAGRRYIDWLIPGLIGLNVMGSSMWGVGFMAVDLRIRKLLKRFSATPMRKRDFLLAVMASRMIFLPLEVLLILLVGWLLFDVSVAGSLVTFVGACVLGAVSFAAVSLLVGSRAQKLETISGLMNAVMVPMWVLSGVFFSADRFPGFMQPAVQALPLTQLNNLLRGVALEGQGVAELWTGFVVVAAWGLVAFPLALRWFRWQ